MDEVRRKNAGITYTERSAEAILQRHRNARCECIQFEGTLGVIKRKKPTGSLSEEDLVRAVTAIYNGDANMSHIYAYLRDSNVDCGPKFIFVECLTFFRATHSWSLFHGSRHQAEPLSVVEMVVNADEQANSPSTSVSPHNLELVLPEFPPSQKNDQSVLNVIESYRSKLRFFRRGLRGLSKRQKRLRRNLRLLQKCWKLKGSST